MDELRSADVYCPYCGESVELLVDCSVTRQEYIEDCEVCCRPMNLIVTIARDGTPMVEARHEDD